ncbi:MAG: PilZ domain-containing protein [Myxococcaceae bacterium]|nr:PilZ domain-containing protein [Myxococcaceae bacterium]
MRKRREQRASVRLPVSIERSSAALTADLSNNGFCLEVPFASFNPGREIQGYVLLGEKELTFRGKVAWFQPGNPMATMWGRAGITLTQVSPGLRALISMRLRGR